MDPVLGDKESRSAVQNQTSGPLLWMGPPFLPHPLLPTEQQHLFPAHCPPNRPGIAEMTGYITLREKQFKREATVSPITRNTTGLVILFEVAGWT